MSTYHSLYTCQVMAMILSMTTSPTRDRLLDAAADLLRSGGVAAVTMAAVARDAEVSRQAAYLHFGDRSELLVALVDRLDEEAGLAKHIATITSTRTAAQGIDAWAEMQVKRNPHIAALARALDAERHSDTGSAAAWRNRSNNRLRFAEMIVDRLIEEEKLHRSWERAHAVRLLAELTSFRVWDDLVNDMHVPPAVYVRMITSAALSTLGSPLKAR